MSRRLPPVSGRQLIGLLERIGYDFIRQRGEHNITIPAHREIARGTLNDILNEVALWTNVPKGQFIGMLQEM